MIAQFCLLTSAFCPLFSGKIASLPVHRYTIRQYTLGTREEQPVIATEPVTTLDITCLQSFTVTLGRQPVAFRSAKGRALLAYLAFEQAHAHQRTTLAGFLWPDEPEAKARRNLTQTLLELRKAIRDADAEPPFLYVTTTTVAFNPASNHQVDVIAFRQALANHDYAQAAALYRGPFLADLVVHDSDLFEDWSMATRERLQQQAIDAYSKLSSTQESQGQLDAALQSVRRLLELTPWQEEAHCQLMRLLARNGQRSAALAQYDTLTALLMDELGVTPAPATDTLYDQILAGAFEPSDPPVPGQPALRITTSSEPPFQALAQPAHFVGRHREIARLRNGMNAPGLQIRAIVGMGGAGKTTLATQLAHAVRREFRDGVLWASTRTNNLLDILASWASAYGYDFSQLSDLESRAAAVRGLLAERQTLLVIDNVQHVRDVEALLPNGGDCAVILTTRDFDVATALNAETIVLGELATTEALELLRQILGDERVEEELAAAIELCTLCGDLPLAVEIAAQRLKSRPRMKLAQMVARLGDQQQRLDLEISDRAVRASFAVSWAALDADLQQLFPLLALFAGHSFTAEAASYVADADPFDVEDQLFALEALSLIRGGESGRYQLHPLLADFASEQLAEPTIPAHRYTDYFYQLVCTAAGEATRLQPEWQQIRAALTVAHRQERWQMVVDFVCALQQPWFRHARYTDARYGFALAVEAATARHDAAAAAALHLQWGLAALEQNDYEDAQQHFVVSLTHYEEQQAAEAIAEVTYHLARIAIERSHYDRAEALLAQSLAIRERLDQPEAIGLVYYRQAMLKYTLRDYSNAKTLIERSLALLVQANARQSMIPVLRLLAQIYLYLEKYALAKQYGEEAKALCEEFANADELATTLYTLTGIYRYLQQYDTALQYAEEGLHYFQRAGMRRLEAMIEYQACRIHMALGDAQAAIRSALASIKIYKAIQDQLGWAMAALQLGDLYRAAGQVAEAAAIWEEGKALSITLGRTQLMQDFIKRLAS